MDITEQFPFDESRALTTTAVAHRLISRYGRRLSISQVQRYCGAGLNVGGTKLRLPSQWSTRGRLVMPEWLAWWQRERNRLMQPPTFKPERTPKQASRAHQRAVKELEARGLKVG